MIILITLYFIVDELNAAELLLDVGLNVPVQLEQVNPLQQQHYLVAQRVEWNIVVGLT